MRFTGAATGWVEPYGVKGWWRTDDGGLSWREAALWGMLSLASRPGGGLWGAMADDKDVVRHYLSEVAARRRLYRRYGSDELWEFSDVGFSRDGRQAVFVERLTGALPRLVFYVLQRDAGVWKILHKIDLGVRY